MRGEEEEEREVSRWLVDGDMGATRARSVCLRRKSCVGGVNNHEDHEAAPGSRVSSGGARCAAAAALRLRCL